MNRKTKGKGSFVITLGTLTLLATALSLVFGGTRAAAQSGTTTVPPLRHVFIVIGENLGYSQTYNSGAMPYLDSLAAKYGLATNYIADTHPSIGNYMGLTTGQILTSNDSLTPSQQTFSADNIFLDVQNAGETWKDYVEEDPNTSGCGALVSGNYYYRHDPAEYFSNINSSNIVCFSQFATDLANHALPNLSWLVPDGYDDGHDSSASAFDSWLQTEIAPLLASSYFQPGGDGLLIVTFDEDENTGGTSCSTSNIESGTWCGGQVETVVISPAIVSAGYQSTNEYHEESTLRLMEEALGLSNFPGASADSTGVLSSPIDMSDFFAQGTTSGGSVSLSPTSVSFASQTVGTTSGAQAITLDNSTSSAVSISGISISGSNSGDFAETNTCGSSLAANSTCSISVTFTPSTTSTESATLTVNDGASSQTASLSGTGSSSSGGGSGPVVSLSPSSLTFASQNVGSTSAAQSVTLSNTGNAALSIGGIAISGADSGDFAQTNTCGSSVAAGANCSISVTFTPAATGSLSASITVSDNASGSPQSGSLSGTGASSSTGGGGGGTGGGANNYYVSTAGSDASGNGTISSPWATIAFASTQVGPGAIVHVAAGTYTGNITTSSSGSSSAPITYEADTANFSGPVNCAQVTANHGSLSSCAQIVASTSGAIWDNSGSYVTIEGFDVTGPNIGMDTDGVGTTGAYTTYIGNSVHNVGTSASCSPNGLAGLGSSATNTTFIGNYVYDIGPSGCGYVNGIYPTTGASSATVENNVVMGLGGTGIQSWSNTGNDIIANNTVLNTQACIAIGTDTSGQTNGNDFTANNICEAQTYGILEEGWGAAATGTNNVYMNNLFYNDSTTYILQNGLAATGTLTADPLFMNYSGDQTGDYHLQPTSPAIAAATSTNAPTTDFDGNTRPQNGNWDIGAYEYMSGGTSSGSVTVSPTSLTFASQTVGTLSTAQVVTLSNSTSSAASITGVSIGGSDSGDFTQTNTCGSSLAASGSCTISVMFDPAATGTLTATLSVNDNATGSPQTLALSGTGASSPSGGSGSSSGSDFTVTSSPASASVNPGTSAAYTIDVAPQVSGGFPNSVGLSCTGLPAYASCSFSPSNVTPAPAAQTSALTISTMGPSAANLPFWPGMPDVPLVIAWLGALLGFAFLAFYAKRMNKRLGFVAASSVMLLSLILPVASCTGGGIGPQNAGTPPGTYAVTVKAQSGQLQHSTSVTLIVK